jgi:hypothetical protein
MRRLFTALCAALITLTAGATSAKAADAVEPGYTALFDGTQASLDRWRQAGPGGFTLGADGTLTSFGGMGLLWYPASQFSNYSLKLDWRMPGDDNGGVFIGFPDPNGDPWAPVSAGHEIQIDATDADPTRTTGSVYSFQAPDAALRASALHPPGQWNTYEIGLHGQRVEIWLNDVKINDYTSPRNIATGYLGVQNDGDGADIAYRNIRIRTDAAATDLARGRPASASSVEAGSPHAAANAVDGSATTRWGSAYTDPQWLQVDLGARYTLSRVRIAWEAAYAKGYRIQVSDDGTAWTDAYSTAAGDGGTDDVTLSGTGRYLRVYGTQRATQWGYSIWDLNAYGTPAGPANLCRACPVTVSSVEPNSPHAAANAVDGNASTRWGSAYADPQWIRLDLGAVRSVGRVRLSWEAAYAKGYRIQLSDDGTTWTDVFTTATGDGGVDDVTVSGSGRYLRVYGTQRATQWGYSLWEAEAYGP